MIVMIGEGDGLTIELKDRRTGDRELRLLAFSTRHERDAIEFARTELQRQIPGCSDAIADDAICLCMSRILDGSEVDDRAAVFVHVLYAAFQSLRGLAVESLPIFGCPHGRVPGVVMVLRRGSGDDIEDRSFLLEFSPTQSATVTECIDDIETRIPGRRSRDIAWKRVSDAISSILTTGRAGGFVDDENATALELMFRRATVSELDDLPHATSADVRRCMYRSEAERAGDAG